MFFHLNAKHQKQFNQNHTKIGKNKIMIFCSLLVLDNADPLHMVSNNPILIQNLITEKSRFFTAHWATIMAQLKIHRCKNKSLCF